MFNSHIRGWINYYGRYYKSALYPTLRHVDLILARWAHWKFKSLATAPTALPALARPHRATTATPVRSLGPASGARLDNGSRMRREPHVRFCERAVVRFRRATHLVAGFEHEADACRFRAAMRARFEEFALSLHPDIWRPSGRASSGTGDARCAAAARPAPLSGTASRRSPTTGSPSPKILHPWPNQRFAVRHPRWESYAESRTYGSVRGVSSNGRPYRDRLRFRASKDVDAHGTKPWAEGPTGPAWPRRLLQSSIRHQNPLGLGYFFPGQPCAFAGKTNGGVVGDRIAKTGLQRCDPVSFLDVPHEESRSDDEALMFFR